MADKYTGWKLFDKVTIVAKPYYSMDYKTYQKTLLGYQGYVVDPSNAKQLKNARSWGVTYEYIYDENHTVLDKIEHQPEEFTFNNNGFTLELKECAKCSSQGGKLSFWNCNISKDGHTFLIGIATDLLLDVLIYNSFVNGICQTPLMFARCNGNVGMLSETMPSYKEALNDIEIRNKMGKGKTSKHIEGHVYETATCKNVYLGKIYRWYKPVFSTNGWRRIQELIGLEKLAKPDTLYFYPDYYEDRNKLSDYERMTYRLQDKKPAARREGVETVELDITLDELCKRITKKYVFDAAEKHQRSYNLECFVGLSANGESYTMPFEVKEALKDLGIKVWEEPKE